MMFTLATSVIQMPAVAGAKGPSVSNGIRQDFLVGICLRKAKSFSRARRRLCCKSQLADFAPVASAAYGIILLSGGLFAFTKSGSKGSLFGGLTGAALMTSFEVWYEKNINAAFSYTIPLLVLVYATKAYFLMQASDSKAIGDALGFGSAFLFSSVFGIRLAATRKLIPAGPLLGLSICALVVFTSAYLQDRL